MWSFSLLPLSYYIMFLLQFSVGIIAFILIYEWLRLSEYMEVRRLLLQFFGLKK